MPDGRRRGVRFERRQQYRQRTGRLRQYRTLDSRPTFVHAVTHTRSMPMSPVEFHDELARAGMVGAVEWRDAAFYDYIVFPDGSMWDTKEDKWLERRRMTSSMTQAWRSLKRRLRLGTRKPGS